jgi:hypothetical protein
MNTTMVRTLAYPPLLTRARRALAALVIGAAIALLAGCDAGNLAAPAGALRDQAARPAAPSEADVQEAALRFLFDNHGAEGMDAYCVSTGWPEANNDPEAALLDRFAGSQPPTVPYSACTISVSGDTYDATGGPAQWFSLGPAAITGRRAELDANWHINGRLAEFYHCTLRLAGDNWRVAGCTLVAAA